MIKVGSDFSGVGAFRQALMKLGIKHKTIFACDMDKYARQTYIANYGEPDYYPENVYDRDIPKESLDIYMTSPPCQAFSLAGKRKGEDDKRGILFYNSHEFIQKNRPRYFIFENVKGLLSDSKNNPKDDLGQTFTKWLTLLGGKSVNGNPIFFPQEDSVPYHIYWKVLNAKDYKVPQNRERVFIVGIRDDYDNVFSWPKPYFLDRRLKDVLEAEVDNKYFLSDTMINGFVSHTKRMKDKGNGFEFKPTDGSICGSSVTTRAGSRPDDNFIKVKSATKYGFEVAKEGDSINLSQPNSQTRRGRVGKSVAQTLDTACNQGVMIGAFRGHNPENPKSRKKGDNYEQTLEINKDGVSNTLSTVQKDNVVVYGNLKGGKWDKTHEQSGRVYNPQGIGATIHTMGGGNQEPKIIQQDYKIRRLTPRECFRLMDFPDTFKIDQVSDTQAYKQAGNSIVVNVLAEIINKLKL